MPRKSKSVYTTPDRVIKDTQKKTKKKSNTSFNDLESTTRIRIDTDRINDVDSLDTSFLEGRIANKTNNNKKVKEKLLTERNQSIYQLGVIKKVLYTLSFFCLGIFLMIFLFNSNLLSSKSKKVEKEEIEEKNEINKKMIILDQNYLFIGDQYTEEIDLDSLSISHVKVASNNFTISDVLEEMREKIYNYNPSVILFELGMNDYIQGKSKEEIVSNMEKVILGIKENRPYSKIYIESLYPINEDLIDKEKYSEISSQEIEDINREIKKLCANEDVQYLDIYQLLSYDGQLRKKYSEDGISLNEDGYSTLQNKIKEVVDENEKNNKE